MVHHQPISSPGGVPKLLVILSLLCLLCFLQDLKDHFRQAGNVVHADIMQARCAGL